MSADATKQRDWLPGGGEMGERTRALDWSKTALGPVSTWPRSLKTIVTLILTSRHPMFLWWGPDLIQFYNDGYRSSLGQDRHPARLPILASPRRREVRMNSARAAGFQSYLRKPIDTQALVQEIARHIALSLLS